MVCRRTGVAVEFLKGQCRSISGGAGSGGGEKNLANKKNNDGRFSLDKLLNCLGLQKLPAKERKMILTLFLLAGMGIGFMFWGTVGPGQSDRRGIIRERADVDGKSG